MTVAPEKRRLNHQVVFVLVLMAFLVGMETYVVANVYSTTQNMRSIQIQQQETNTANLAASLLAGSPPTLGSPNATVAIVEFGDYQCPTCGGWFKTQEASVIQNLVNTTKAKLVWRDFDYYGADSVSASEAAYAAGAQGMFWKFHEILFQNQQTPNNGWASRQNLVEFAQQLSLNMTEFNLDFNSGQYDSLINANHALGVEAGVAETPTFFLIGPNAAMVTIGGGQPESVFEQAVTQLNSAPTGEYPSFAAASILALLVIVTLSLVRRRVRKRSQARS